MNDLGYSLVFSTALPKDIGDELRACGVCLDDWDYMIIAPPDAIGKDEHYSPEDDSEYLPNEYFMGRLLNGVCSNVWYPATIRGEAVAVGVAYHS